jgi:hypothetical protein
MPEAADHLHAARVHEQAATRHDDAANIYASLGDHVLADSSVRSHAGSAACKSSTG